MRVQKKDGMNYAPKGKSQHVVAPGEFKFAALALDHGHIYGQCNGLVEAGAELAKVYDPDPEKMARFIQEFPRTEPARCAEEILEDPEIKLVASAAIPCDRGPLGLRVMDHGKDYFADKAPFTTLQQLEAAQAKVAETGMKYMVYYSERLHVEGAVYAGQLIEQGAIGKLLHMEVLAPHRLNAPSRPDWFFERDKYGGILVDIGSHQIEQFLHFSGATDAEIQLARVGNLNNPQYPGLDDFGDAMLRADTGPTLYCRVDWFTPNGMRSWGDGRMFIMGTEGTIEVRKYLDLARGDAGDQVFLVNGDEEQHFSVHGKVGFPFFGQLVLDCVNRTENAMTQAHAFKTAEICLRAQEQAIQIHAV